MNLITTLAVFLLLASCSKSNEKSLQNQISQSEDSIYFGELNVSVPLSGILASSPSLDFASLAYKQTGKQDLVITNSSSSILTYLPEDFDASQIAPFEITSNGCLAPLGGRRKCVIKFSVSNSVSNSEDQIAASVFKIKNVDVNLNAILEKDETDYDAPVTGILVSPLNLNFGSFKVEESKELSMTVRNTNPSGSKAIEIGILSNPNVSISFNSCPANLNARATCAIKLKYTGTIAESFSSENLLLIANNQVTYSATVASPSIEEPEILNIEPQVPSSSVAINQPALQTGTIVFENTGSVSLPAPVSAISSNEGIEITSISCASGLVRSKTCTINYTINSPSLPAGESVQTIKLQSGTIASEVFSLNLNVTPDFVPCTLSDAQANGVDILNSNSTIVGNKSGEDISQCLLAANACNQYYSISVNSKSCDPIVSACTPSEVQDNGWNITQAATYSGNRVGPDISQCSVASCNNEYDINLVGKVCEGIICSLANAQGNGITSILNVSAVSGSIHNDSCLVSSCNEYYKNAIDNRSCLPKLCNELNSGELLSLGFDTTGATISGTYPSCSLSCSSSFQQLSIDSKSCEDKIPTVTTLRITNKNASGYVKDSFLQLTIAGTNAQQMKISNQSDCSDGVYESYATSKQFTINDTNVPETQRLYIQLKNITAETSCFSAPGAVTLNTASAYIHDSLAPIVTMTNPANGSSTSNTAVTVSGSCEAGSSVFIREGVLTENSIACPSSTYSYGLTLSSTLGSKSISARQIDLAGNQTITTNTITLAGPPCTSGDAATYYVNLANATGIGGTVPNCVVASCNSGYSKVNNDKACAKSNATAYPVASGQITRVKSFDNKLFVLTNDGVVRTFNGTTNLYSNLSVDPTYSQVNDMEIMNGQLLFLSYNAAFTNFKVKKYNPATPTSPVDVYTGSVNNSYFEFARYTANNLGGSPAGDGVSDSKRFYLIKSDFTTNIKSLHSYTNSVANNFSTGGTFSTVGSSGQYGGITVFGQTANCLYYTSRTNVPSYSWSLNRTLRGDGVSGCSPISVTLAGSNPIERLGITSNYIMYTLGFTYSQFWSLDRQAYTLTDNSTTPVEGAFAMYNFPLSGDLYVGKIQAANPWYALRGWLRLTNLTNNTGNLAIGTVSGYPSCYYNFGSNPAVFPFIHNAHNYNNEFTIGTESFLNVGFTGASGSSYGDTDMPTDCPTSINGAALSGKATIAKINSATNTITPVIPIFNPKFSYPVTTTGFSLVANSSFYFMIKKAKTFAGTVSSDQSDYYYIYKYNSATNKLDLVSDYPANGPTVPSYSHQKMVSLGTNIYLWGSGTTELIKIIP